MPVRSHGEVHVVSRVVGFKKIKFYTNENVGSGDLDLPEQQMHTTSYWLTIPASLIGMLPYAADDRRDGIVGPRVCDPPGGAAAVDVRRPRRRHLDLGFGIRDSGFGSDADQPNPESQIPNPDGVRVFVYDNYPGGIGFSAPLLRDARRAARAYASADCRLRVRAGLSRLRRSGRQHRSAGQGGGAAYSGSDAGRAAGMSAIADRIRGIVKAPAPGPDAAAPPAVR